MYGIVYQVLYHSILCIHIILEWMKKDGGVRKAFRRPEVFTLCVCVCVRVCVRACVRVRVCFCVRACVRYG